MDKHLLVGLLYNQEVFKIGEQFVPDRIGKEVGVAADLRKGHPKPREIKSQKIQYASMHEPEGDKSIKWSMRKKVREHEDGRH